MERLIARGSDARRRVLGVSVALSQAEIHWQSFLASLVTSSMRVLEFMASYDRARLRAIRRATNPSNARHRCEFRLAQNAIRRDPNFEIRERIGSEQRAAWNAVTLDQAEVALVRPVASDRRSAPKLARWLGEYVPDNLAGFTLFKAHRRHLHTLSPIERITWQELKCRTAQARAFPSENSLMWMVNAILAVITRNGPQAPRPTSSGDAKMRDLLPAKFQTSGCSIRQR